LEVIKYKFTGLKLSQEITGILKKKFNAIIDKPEKAPNFLSAGITYLIPKSGEINEVRNYRPTTCLTTMQKTQIGKIAKIIFTHFEEQRLQPAE